MPHPVRKKPHGSYGNRWLTNVNDRHRANRPPGQWPESETSEEASRGLFGCSLSAGLPSGVSLTAGAGFAAAGGLAAGCLAGGCLALFAAAGCLAPSELAPPAPAGGPAGAGGLGATGPDEPILTEIPNSITVGTARSHLSRIFDKAGVRHQAELVRLLLQKWNRGRVVAEQKASWAKRGGRGRTCIRAIPDRSSRPCPAAYGSHIASDCEVQPQPKTNPRRNLGGGFRIRMPLAVSLR